MARTARRPLASGRVAPWHGLVFGIVLGVLAVVQLAITVNPLTAALAATGLLGYVFLYTIWLKPRTPQNIVIGGAAGAMPPLVGWAAATGELSLDALWLFAVVFFWTPPHFWALSLLIKDDYARTGTPMLPVVAGEETTRRQILLYSLLLVGLTTLPVFTGLFGGLYLAAALVLGGVFIALAARCCETTPAPPRAGSTSARCSTWRCCSSRWPSTERSDRQALMDRETATRNLRAGIGAGALGLVVFALAFYVTILYLA